MGRGQGTDFGATGVVRRDADAHRQEQTDFANRERGGAVSPQDAIAKWTGWIGDVATLYEASGEHESYDELDARTREICERMGFEPTGDDTLYAELSEWASNATLGAPTARESTGADDQDFENSGILLSVDCMYLVRLSLDLCTVLVVAVDASHDPVQAFLSHTSMEEEAPTPRHSWPKDELAGSAFEAVEAFLATTGSIEWALGRL